MHNCKSERAHPSAIICSDNNIANNDMMMTKVMITKRENQYFNKIVYIGSIFPSKVIGVFELH